MNSQIKVDLSKNCSLLGYLMKLYEFFPKLLVEMIKYVHTIE